MRRLLRRTLSSAGNRKSGSRHQQSVSVETYSWSEIGGTEADTESLPVPEQRGVDDIDERLEMIAKKSRSQSQGLDQQSDSGCEVGADTISGDGQRRSRVLVRQYEMMSSGTSSVISPASSTSLGRLQRRRVSLRSFRIRSEKFLRSRMRPSCLRGGCDPGDTYGPSRGSRTKSDTGVLTVGGSWVTAPRTVNGQYVPQWMSENAAASSRTWQSSRSDVTTLPTSSVDAAGWNDRSSSLESSPSAFCPALPLIQV